MLKKIREKHSFRGWHIWVSLLLALPILIVGLTAVFIAHEKSLGTKMLYVPAFLSPGSVVKVKQNADLELRSFARASDGSELLGSKMGLYWHQAGKPVVLVDGPDEARNILSSDKTGWLVAAKNGIWQISQDGSKATLAQDGDFHGLAQSGGLLTAVSRKDGILMSVDAGKTWQTATSLDGLLSLVTAQMEVAAEEAPSKIPLSKVIMDMHTGKAFLGKQLEWIWIDVVGGAMVLLTFTGLIMWWRGRQRKQAAATRSKPETSPATDNNAVNLA